MTEIQQAENDPKWPMPMHFEIDTTEKFNVLAISETFLILVRIGFGLQMCQTSGD